MTILESPPVEPGDTVSTGGVTPPEAPEPVERAVGSWTDPRRLAVAIVACLVVLVVSLATVLYALGPLLHDREQRQLLSAERVAISDAARDNQGIHRVGSPTEPPTPGSTVGILDIPAIGLQQAVVEAVGSSQTASGPGHVPGTAGLGQPGNSAVVGRRSTYGGPFGRLDQLRPGQRIVTATTEGESQYVVRSVRTVSIVSSGSGGRTGVTAKTLYGPTNDNQITLVTSASAAPWNTTRALVVVARMQGRPFTQTPQESRSPSQQGNTGDPDDLSALLLALLALVATAVAAVFFYRRSSMRSAYLLSTAPLLFFTIFAAEAASHLLPAWL